MNRKNNGCSLVALGRRGKSYFLQASLALHALMLNEHAPVHNDP